MWGEDWKGAQERLFIREDGAPIYPGTINLWLDRFLKKHDLKRLTPHSLCHTFATLQIAAGVDIRTVQARTGHAQASTLVNIYSHDSYAIESAQEPASDMQESVLLPDKKKQKKRAFLRIVGGAPAPFRHLSISFSLSLEQNLSIFPNYIDRNKNKKANNPNGYWLFPGDPSEIRTPDTLIKSQVLCQLS